MWLHEEEVAGESTSVHAPGEVLVGVEIVRQAIGEKSEARNGYLACLPAGGHGLG